MITLDDLRRASSLTVRTTDGHDLGEVEGVWYEDRTGLVRWFQIRRGLFGVRHATIPANGVELGVERIEIPWSRQLVADAPHGDETDDAAMRALASHYGAEDAGATTRSLLFAEIEPVDEEAETQRW